MPNADFEKIPPRRMLKRRQRCWRTSRFSLHVDSAVGLNFILCCAIFATLLSSPEGIGILLNRRDESSGGCVAVEI